uniref:CCHC-type domain-containing protein n=1 Tax=Gasterosteus aculeatus aculeatus TaxID=481459 RepID=A0AAQ4PKW1_GASAC
MSDPDQRAVGGPSMAHIVKHLAAVQAEHGQRLGRVGESVHNLAAALQDFQQYTVHTAVQALAATAPVEAPSTRGTLAPALPQSALHLAPPQRYDGSPELCRGFLTQCSLIFELQSPQFASDRAKVAFIISRLTGRALVWATAVWDQQEPVCSDHEGFMQRLRQVFGHSTSLQEAARRLLKLRQGPRSVSDFSIDFRTLATESGWEDSALMPTFYHGLSESLKDELVNRDWGNTLEDLISLATQLDRRRRERQQEKESRGSDDHPLRGLPHSVPEGTPGPEGETVQRRKTRLSPEERDQRRREWLCFYCGKAGHYRNNCPHRRTREQPLTVSTLFCPNISQHQCLVPVTIIGSRGQATTVPALIDSGSAGNFISRRLVQQLQLATLPCSPPLSITAINNQPLGSGFISQVTVPVTLVVGVLHSEELSLLVIDNVSNDVILGLPWLAFHEPQISWNTNELLRWGDKCVSQCLTKPLRTATIRSTATAATPEVPPAYQDLAAVFSKASAECLPPHRPWDCAIDLVPGATLPRGRIFPLSLPESRAMEKYVEEALAN